MKNILLLIVVGILVLSGLGAVNAQEKEMNLEDNGKILFSQPIIEDRNEYEEVTLDEGNSFLMEPGKPMLPTRIEKYTFYLCTKWKSI